MISQFFILSPRGDVIVRREYLGNVPRVSPEIFFRHFKFWGAGAGEGGSLGEDREAPPVFAVDGVTYLHIREGGLQLLATTRDNVAPSFVLEFLRRMCVLIKVRMLGLAWAATCCPCTMLHYQQMQLQGIGADARV